MEQPCVSVAIEPFLRQMAADGRSPCSIESYRRQLVMLASGLGDVTLGAITVDRLNAYLISPQVLLRSDGAPKRASSVNRAKSIIRAFFGWCERARSRSR
jgi:site-specific recombinase XerD